MAHRSCRLSSSPAAQDEPFFPRDIVSRHRRRSADNQNPTHIGSECVRKDRECISWIRIGVTQLVNECTESRPIAPEYGQEGTCAARPISSISCTKTVQLRNS